MLSSFPQPHPGRSISTYRETSPSSADISSDGFVLGMTWNHAVAGMAQSWCLND